MTKTQAIEYFRKKGEPKERAIQRIAAVLDVNPSRIHQLPEELDGTAGWRHQCVLHVFTDGELTARRHQLERLRDRKSETHEERRHEHLIEALAIIEARVGW